MGSQRAHLSRYMALGNKSELSREKSELSRKGRAQAPEETSGAPLERV